MKPTLFIDTDGVLCQFHKFALKKFIPKATEDFHWPKTARNLYDAITSLGGIIDVPDSNLLDKLDYDFWACLPPYDYAVELVSYLQSFECDLYLVTAAMSNRDMLKARYFWFKQHFPELTPHKIIFNVYRGALGGQGKILVDDNSRNCDYFVSAGGMAVLVRRPWNGLSSDNISFDIIRGVTNAITRINR